MNPPEHRERRGAGLARRLEGPVAALPGRKATPSVAVQRGCHAARMPGGVRPRAAPSPWMNPPEHRERRGAGLARRLEGPVAALPGRKATPSVAVQRGCHAARMPGGVRPRAAPSPWMNPPEHRERRGAGLARRLEGPVAALPGRKATPSAAARRGCHAARMPGGVRPWAVRASVRWRCGRPREWRASAGRRAGRARPQWRPALPPPAPAPAPAPPPLRCAIRSWPASPRDRR